MLINLPLYLTLSPEKTSDSRDSVGDLKMVRINLVLD
jgi:hypothetical protein